MSERDCRGGIRRTESIGAVSVASVNSVVSRRRIRTELTTRMSRMKIRVRLKLMRHREDLVVVEQIAREHRADRLRHCTTMPAPPATPALSTPAPSPRRSPAPSAPRTCTARPRTDGRSVACNPTSPLSSRRHVHVEVLQELRHLHHENMLTALRLNEIERERGAPAGAARERCHRRRIAGNAAGAAPPPPPPPPRPPPHPRRRDLRDHSPRQVIAMSTPSSFAFICT